MGLILGVGLNDCPGWSGRSNLYNFKVYRMWHHMLNRCYSAKYLETRLTYVGCTVCERWHILSNFAEDIKSLPNYDLWVKGINNVLDKDIRVPGNKVYSPQTCMFVTKSQSSSDVQRNHPGSIHSSEARLKKSIKIGRAVKATNLVTGKVEIFRSQLEASKALGVSPQSISSVIVGRRDSSKGYSFEKVEEVI